MLKITLIIIAIAAFVFFVAYFIIRSWMVQDYRQGWYASLKDDPDALRAFTTRTPSYSKMLWSFRQLKDTNWYPADLRAARYSAELSPELRNKLKQWVTEKPTKIKIKK